MQVLKVLFTNQSLEFQLVEEIQIRDLNKGLTFRLAPSQALVLSPLDSLTEYCHV